MDNMEIKRIFDRHYAVLFEKNLNTNRVGVDVLSTAKLAESLTVKYVQTVMNLVGNSPWDPRLNRVNCKNSPWDPRCVLGDNPFNWKPYIVGNSPWDPR